MTDLDEIAELISHSLSIARKGAPRLFGVWFGKPYDSGFTVTSCRVLDSHLVLDFDCGALLHVWAPQEAICNHEVFQIKHARKVRLEWPADPLKRSPDIHFMELVNRGATIDTLPPEEGLFSVFRATLAKPAFELL